MSEPYYLTTAIAYPNGDPHVGHAYEYIATDAIARFKRLDGFDVRFLTGTDVHGLKMAEAAAAYSAHPALLRLQELEALRELAGSANARIYIGFDKHAQPPAAEPARSEAN